MKLYSYDEIKAAGDCVSYMTGRLGLKPESKRGEWTRFNCPWRPGSDSGAFAVRREGWHDHVEKEHGSIIDLCARASHNGDMMAAQAELGSWLGLTPKMASRPRPGAKSGNITATYDYVDMAGRLVFQVCRIEPGKNGRKKDFLQRRPNPAHEEGWVWNLDGVDLVPYRLPEWAGQVDGGPVILVEGEKDADNLAALGFQTTTLPMGAGKWRDEYARWFRGVPVILWTDNDEPGREHGDVLAWSMREIAGSIQRMSAPPPHKDASDWIAAGAKRADIELALLDADPVDLGKVRPPKAEALSEAKRANAQPFRNFYYEVGENDKLVKRPRHINEMREDMNRRFWGFPRRVGNDLFDHDRASGRIRSIDKPASLLAWITEKSGHPVEWGRFEGCVTSEQYFESVFWNAHEYQGVSGVPTFPAREDVYYTHETLPPPSADGKAFDGLVDFFKPATDLDRMLIRTMFATPLWYAPGEDRPLFVIDSRDGKGSGKTKLVGYLAALYGDNDPALSTPITVEQRDLREGQLFDRVVRRMMSRDGRRRRVFLIDNVTGFYDSSALASIITMPVLSGMAPYGRNEESRPNDLTFCMTVNSATLGTDLVSRAVFVEIRRPDLLKGETRNWERRILRYIRENRMRIIADIIHVLQSGADFSPSATSRFAAWERAIMAPICGDADTYSSLWKLNRERSESADGDSDEAEAIRERIRAEIRALGFDPDNDALWLRSDTLKRWTRAAIEGFGGRDGRGATHALRNLAKDGLIPELSAYPQKYPHHGASQTRGMMWRYDLVQDPDWSGTVHEIYYDGDKALWRQAI